MFLINFAIGDWSDDGHGHFESRVLASSLPVREVRELHFAASELLGFDLGDICREYGESSIAQAQAERLRDVGAWPEGRSDLLLTPDDLFEIWWGALRAAAKERGVAFDLGPQNQAVVGPEHIEKALRRAAPSLDPALAALTPEQVLSLLNGLAIHSHGRKNEFSFSVSATNGPVSDLHFYGYDAQKRHLRVPGYGLFEA